MLCNPGYFSYKIQLLNLTNKPLSFSTSEPFLSGLVHSERPVVSFPSVWGYRSYCSQPTLSHHWGTLPWRCTAVPAELPYPSQTYPRERATSSLCEYNKKRPLNLKFDCSAVKAKHLKWPIAYLSSDLFSFNTCKKNVSKKYNYSLTLM